MTVMLICSLISQSEGRRLNETLRGRKGGERGKKDEVEQKKGIKWWISPQSTLDNELSMNSRHLQVSFILYFYGMKWDREHGLLWASTSPLIKQHRPHSGVLFSRSIFASWRLWKQMWNVFSVAHYSGENSFIRQCGETTRITLGKQHWTKLFVHILLSEVNIVVAHVF